MPPAVAEAMCVGVDCTWIEREQAPLGVEEVVRHFILALGGVVF